MPFKTKEQLKEYHRGYYARNKGIYKNNAKNQREKLYEIIREAKDRPCVDCNIKYPPYVMDFDHINDDKDHNIAQMTTLGSPKKLRAEIAKCEVVCSNCHRERTHQRQVTEGNRTPTPNFTDSCA
jgi:hypothetical protein